MSLLGEVLLNREEDRQQQQQQRGWCKPRARKVTITEIVGGGGNSSGCSSGGSGVSSDDDDCGFVERSVSVDSAVDGMYGGGGDNAGAAAAMDADEIFEELDELVQDWKTKLESIVGEGLKKIRRSGKEKKAMMKYLPGQASQGARAERALEEARATVVRDWKNEFGRSLAVVFRRLEKLNADSNRRAEDVVNNKIIGSLRSGHGGGGGGHLSQLGGLGGQQNKKTIVNLEFDSCDNYGSLRQLAKDLEAVCSLFGSNNSSTADIPAQIKSEIPVYGGFKMVEQRANGKNGGGGVAALDQLGKMGRQLPVLHGGDVGEDIILSPQWRKLKPERRETHLHRAQKKMLERKQEKKQKKDTGRNKSSSSSADGRRYRVVQVAKKGGARYFVVKKKRSSADDEEAEEIFNQWLKNLESPPAYGAAAARRKIKKRTRKLSHRSVRKTMLKEKEKAGSMLYASVVKKHLKGGEGEATSTSAEDIFEAWRSNLDVPLPVREEVEKEVEAAVDAADIFKVWRHNLKAERAYGKKVPTAQTGEEEILATARFFQKELRLGEAAAFTTMASPLSPRATGVGSVMPEDIFSTWRQNLEDGFFYSSNRKKGCNPGHRPPHPLTKKGKKKKAGGKGPWPEDCFRDWIENLKEPEEFYLRPAPPPPPPPPPMATVAADFGVDEPVTGAGEAGKNTNRKGAGGNKKNKKNGKKNKRF